ncbi:diguanylate cyclase/phosphodiesterase [Bradyrhizobium oligotrophicum S58]|uniref:Diguanylate cyclase/phosphodiesterase n=1 Tax=Bradyrhizobium oligotrophicum S58 TaxID=1245469 RepID=M4Z9Y9_9BRAD|nr:EAL domain-containing protein [Bradyrhizobium oligotrophicum]BAM90633.1 diguanylate cyclase/phosphodiesterase [Bradyrhizobium oligotrophicum S58]
MSAATTKAPATISNDLFDDIPVLRRKWQAALKPGQTLPRYEDVMLGSLGRLADHIAVLNNEDGRLQISRSGRYVQQWLQDERWDIAVDSVSPDCATVLVEAANCALASGQPYLANAHCVRDGMVRTYDVLALPTNSRWGSTLVGTYVNERTTQYNLLDAIFSTTDDGVVSLATIRDSAGAPSDFQIVHHNRAAADLLRLPSATLQWHRLKQGGNMLCSPEVLARLFKVVGLGQRDQFELDCDDRSLRLGAHAFGDIVSLTIADVTAMKRREASFRLLFDVNPVPMCILDRTTAQFLNVNDALVRHYGYGRPDFLRMSVWDLWPPGEWETLDDALSRLADSNEFHRDWRHRTADGSEIEVLTYGREIAFDGRDGVLVAIVDITERRRAEARIAYMAHHDGLTGLPNREFFQQRLTQELDGAVLENKHIAVMCIDLDLFKTINDSFGHPMGDRLLQAVAGRLRQQMHGDHLAARLGGDEFAVILGRTGADEASASAAHLISALSAPYDIGGNELVIGASIGIALSPGDGASWEELMKNADMALYRAKQDGGRVHRFFEKEMDRQAQKRRDMEHDLRLAFAQGEFELHYQPLVDVATTAISAFECLLRWHHPDKGMISPADFIPVAEDIGLIVPLGEWVLREASHEAAKWPEGIKVAVNLSAVQFRSRNLVQVVMQALAQSALAPERLELEITESILLAETEANLATLHQLRQLGIRISMDDFGTGYSSLSYLRSFPFDKIKIDRSFVKDLAQRSDCLAIVRAISGLGKSLNIITTAEGVETSDQLDWLRAEGCNQVQGFLFSAARPASEIAGLLAQFGARASKAA